MVRAQAQRVLGLVLLEVARLHRRRELELEGDVGEILVLILRQVQELFVVSLEHPDTPIAWLLRANTCSA